MCLGKSDLMLIFIASLAAMGSAERIQYEFTGYVTAVNYRSLEGEPLDPVSDLGIAEPPDYLSKACKYVFYIDSELDGYKIDVQGDTADLSDEVFTIETDDTAHHLNVNSFYCEFVDEGDQDGMVLPDLVFDPVSELHNGMESEYRLFVEGEELLSMTRVDINGGSASHSISITDYSSSESNAPSADASASIDEWTFGKAFTGYEYVTGDAYKISLRTYLIRTGKIPEPEPAPVPEAPLPYLLLIGCGLVLPASIVRKKSAGR